jgi:hypothetical protein
MAGKCGCTPLVCGALGAPQCGAASDGCGGTIDCGGCASGAACVGNHCSDCVPKTCAEEGASCGPATDGCGNLLACGTFPNTMYRTVGMDSSCVGGVYSKAYVACGFDPEGCVPTAPPGGSCVSASGRLGELLVCCQ